MIGTNATASLRRRRPSAGGDAGPGLLSEEIFLRLLCLERKRTERSGRRFVLMLLEAGNLLGGAQRGPLLAKLLTSIQGSTRDTDLVGWYRRNSVMGVIFTEVGNSEDKSVVQTLSGKVTESLYDVLTVEEMNDVRLSFHVFPEDWDRQKPDSPVTTTLRVALNPLLRHKKAELGLKRAMDILGSLTGLFLCLPVMIVIALSIKLTSKGPILFRQVRLGRHGQKFTFLKFRSMHVNNDPKIHEEYVKRFIQGAASTEQSTGTQQEIYKLTADPRITAVGRFLRNTSLDELPQFFNVLHGEMSLVGPRPPLTYEVERYDLWHRQRLSAVKPGITGLWQVDGRSRVKFDDMVRLDIRYARSWSLWLDFKILLRTPRAVLSGNGAC